MNQGFFVTGTDTGVGKTLVACGLARSLRELGFKVGVMKPAETGCKNVAGHLVPQDAARLKEAAACDEPVERICPYRLATPLAPSVAAQKAGVKISPPLLVRLCRDMALANDVMLVEGAGGLMVPLVSNYTYADLALELTLPVLVVVANRLGAINHALLTLDHAVCMRLNVAGYILNNLESHSTPASKTNAETLRGLTQVPCIGEMPYLVPDQPGEHPETRKDLGTVFRRYLDFKLIKELM